MKSAGFTVIELILVVTIISVLLAVAIPEYGNYTDGDDGVPSTVNHPITVLNGRYWVGRYVSRTRNGRYHFTPIECIGGVAYTADHVLTDPNGMPVLCEIPSSHIIKELK